jgi:transketolase
MVIAPADQSQARSALEATVRHPGPVCYRIDKNERPELPGLSGRFALGRPELIRTGFDVLLLATGSITYEVLKAAEQLGAAGFSTAVAVLAHLPFEPSAELRGLLGEYATVVTVEEGSTAGGARVSGRGGHRPWRARLPVARAGGRAFAPAGNGEHCLHAPDRRACP